MTFLAAWAIGTMTVRRANTIHQLTNQYLMTDLGATLCISARSKWVVMFLAMVLVFVFSDDQPHVSAAA
jgi:hypothetical protein